MDTTWSTPYIAAALLRAGHHLWVFERGSEEVQVSGRITARAFHFPPGPITAAELLTALHSRTATRVLVRLQELDVLLLRRAPIDWALLGMATRLEQDGVQVVNRPIGLLAVTDKRWLASLPDVPKPATLVTRSSGQAQLFYESASGEVIMKPARGSGGRGVHLLQPGRPERFIQAFLALTRNQQAVTLQYYVPEAEQGESRVLWMDGRVLGGYLRHRSAGEFRHNLKQGGTPGPLELSSQQMHAIDRLTPHLRAAGITFAGLDLLGPYVLEANVLNPGGVYHTDRIHEVDTAQSVVRHLEAMTSTSP